MNMGTSTKQQNKVPGLRFEEFHDTWRKTTLSELSVRIGDGIHTTPKYSDTGEFFFVNGNNLDNGKIKISETTKRLTSSEAAKHFRDLDTNTLLLSINGTVGNVARYNNESITLGKSACYIKLNQETKIGYLYYLIQTNEVQMFYHSEVTGSTIKNLSLKSVANTPVYIPSGTEQQKIADFLGSVDAWLDNLRKQKTALETYKRGMMQKLFTQQVRFKGDGEWMEKQLCDLLDYKQPTQFIVQSTEYSDDYKTPVLTAGKSFILGYTNETEGIFDYELPVIIFDDFTTATQFVDFPFKVKSSAMKILVPLDDNNVKFLYEAMQHIKFEVGGHGRHWISKYSKLTIMVPSPEVQQKIAEFAQSLDDLIAAKSEELSKVEQWKRGLMQKMFV